MTNHPSRTETAANRRAARAAGFLIREGSFTNTTDDRLGRWYLDHKDATSFRPYGPGYGTQAEAWAEAARQAEFADRS